MDLHKHENLKSYLSRWLKYEDLMTCISCSMTLLMHWLQLHSYDFWRPGASNHNCWP